MRIFLAIIFSIAAIGHSLAADAWARAGSTKDAPVSNVDVVETARQSWTAIWGAALIGYSMSNTRLGLDYLTSEGEGDSRWENLAKVNGFGGQGWDFTAQVGGDIEVRGIVAGVFGEYSLGGISSEASLGNFAKLEVEQQDSYCLLGRLGVARGETLFYGASGICHTEVEATLRIGEDSAKQTLEFDGVPLEGGIEHRFGANIRGRLAARYTWYGEETVAGGDDDGVRLTAKPDQWSVKAGIVITTGGDFRPLN